QREVIFTVDPGVASRDNLSIRLYGNGEHPRHGSALRICEIGDHSAACAKAGVAGAVAVVAHEREIGSSVTTGPSRRNDLSPRLRGNGECHCADAREIVGHSAVRSEAGVEGAVTVVPRQRDVVDPVDMGDPGRENFAVRLQGNGERHISDAEISGHYAADAEGGVERAIAVVARQRELDASGESGRSRRNNFSIRLYDNAMCEVVVAAEIGDHLATYAEAGAGGGAGLTVTEGWREHKGERQ